MDFTTYDLLSVSLFRMFLRSFLYYVFLFAELNVINFHAFLSEVEWDKTLVANSASIS